jgi:hypothetical protein
MLTRSRSEPVRPELPYEITIRILKPMNQGRGVRIRIERDLIDSTLAERRDLKTDKPGR